MKDDSIKKKKKINKKILITIFIVVSLFVILGVGSILFIPRVKLNGLNYITISLNNEYKESGAVAKYAFNDVSDELQIKGNVDVNKPGKYEIEYIIAKGLLKQKATRIVEVIDDIYPTIELKGDKKLTLCPLGEYNEQGYTAVDNYDGDITSKVEINKKDNLISYIVKDSSNNKTIVSREIERVDKSKPSIKLKGSSIIYLTLNSNYKDPGHTVTDNCDKDLDSKVVVSGIVNTKKEGTYSLKYDVTDSAGNTSNTTRAVVVYSKASDVAKSGKKGVIYLTFDDGPSSSITPGILNILKEKNVKATFFVINRSSDLDYLIKREHNEGHTVALHSYTHKYDKVYESGDAYFEDLNKISNRVKSLIGVESKIIRFPGGASNTISRNYSKGIMTYLSNEVINRGYHYFDWNVSSGDAGGASNKDQVYRNVVNGLSKSRSNVVLMHDFESNYKTLNALSDIIEYGINNGYIFEAITMSTPLVTHGVNN